MYLVNDSVGDIEVTTLTAVLRRRTTSTLAIKVDVEGQEGAVLCGVADEIRLLKSVLVFVELNRAALKRVGISENELLKRIETIRPFVWVNATDGRLVDAKGDILEQVKLSNQCDLIGIGGSS
jgi:hypothetical protein